MSLIKANGLKDSNGDTSFPVLPAGEYTCRVTKCEDQKTKPDSKNPNCTMWNFHCQVQSENEDHQGQKLFQRVLLPSENMSPDTYQFCVNNLKHFAMACGIDVNSDEIDSQDFIGSEFKALVIVKTYEGKERNEIKDALPIE